MSISYYYLLFSMSGYVDAIRSSAFVWILSNVSLSFMTNSVSLLCLGIMNLVRSLALASFVVL